MRFLEYMGFVLAVFPLKYGFIIVQTCMYTVSLHQECTHVKCIHIESGYLLLVNVSENKQQPKHQLSPNNSISNTALMQTSKSA